MARSHFSHYTRRLASGCTRITRNAHTRRDSAREGQAAQSSQPEVMNVHADTRIRPNAYNLRPRRTPEDTCGKHCKTGFQRAACGDGPPRTRYFSQYVARKSRRFRGLWYLLHELLRCQSGTPSPRDRDHAPGEVGQADIGTGSAVIFRRTFNTTLIARPFPVARSSGGNLREGRGQPQGPDQTLLLQRLQRRPACPRRPVRRFLRSRFP